MFESVNKGFGSVHCATVVSESPSAQAVADVVSEYAGVRPILDACRAVGVTGEQWRAVSHAVALDVRERRQYRLVRTWEREHGAPYGCRGCEHLYSGGWNSCGALAPDLFCDVYRRGEWERVSESYSY